MLKIGRYVFDINEKDLILDDEFAYTLVTRFIRKRDRPFDKISVKLSKTAFNKLRKEEIIYTDDSLKDYRKVVEAKN